ncbi:hypothetical protein JR316_0012999 [Psilocybe cubensis]|uniref:Uncharacterized protein n=2 Tax=Psilocybe cubensis TaxID=181762 RepID=A0ACB8GG61_PSICU|nr:hypothetical protein JR316_0012999 [Psilocybe cubensis]KAH9474537.1 hypothetical protein JR316_0012999 [Psilocybe cubensis]
MKFTSAIALVLAALPVMVSSAATGTNATDACIQACCDAVVPGVRPSGNVGINCHADNTGDCPFTGQVRACCTRIGGFGSNNVGTGLGCN